MSEVRPGLPYVSSALGAWSQWIEMFVVGKEIDEYNVIESRVPFRARGIRYPMKAQSLMMRPEGERAWKWETLLVIPTEQRLEVGDEVMFGADDTRYRIVAKRDWSEYGYIEFDMCQGYET